MFFFLMPFVEFNVFYLKRDDLFQVLTFVKSCYLENGGHFLFIMGEGKKTEASSQQGSEHEERVPKLLCQDCSDHIMWFLGTL